MGPCVTAQTFFVYDSGRGLAELENLRRIPACVHVCLAGAVAAFAGYALAPVLQGKARVGSLSEFLCYVRMAGFAGLGPDKLIGVRRAWTRMGNRCLLWLRARGSRRTGH